MRIRGGEEQKHSALPISNAVLCVPVPLCPSLSHTGPPFSCTHRLYCKRQQEIRLEARNLFAQSQQVPHQMGMNQMVGMQGGGGGMNQMNNTMVQGQGVGLSEELKQGMARLQGKQIGGGDGGGGGGMNPMMMQQQQQMMQQGGGMQGGGWQGNQGWQGQQGGWGGGQQGGNNWQQQQQMMAMQQRQMQMQQQRFNQGNNMGGGGGYNNTGGGGGGGGDAWGGGDDAWGDGGESNKRGRHS